MTRVLLDTQVLILLGTQGIEAIPQRVRRILKNPATLRYVSSLSITEIAIKTSIGKLDSAPHLVDELNADLEATVLAYTAQHALKLFELPLHHREPFDRMLIAVALAEHLPLVGSDRAFSLYRPQGLEVIWN